MGWRGTLRSLNAAANRSARESERRRKRAMKEEALFVAQEAVEAYEDWVDELKSVHVADPYRVDWRLIAESDPPTKPTLSSPKAPKAEAALKTVKPGFFDFLLGGFEKKKLRRETALAKAIEDDRLQQARIDDEYRGAMAEWEEDVAQAERVLALDPKAISEAVQEGLDYKETPLVGTSMKMSFGDDFASIIVTVHSEKVIPSVRRKLTKAGNLSETDMPVSQFNDLYQDHVCSVVLRILRDIFALVPYEKVIVTAGAERINPANGHQELQPIVSVRALRAQVEGLGFRALDPSSALSNFETRMSFKRSSGFATVEAFENF